jgi:hypothetical protein
VTTRGTRCRRSSSIPPRRPGSGTSRSAATPTLCARKSTGWLTPYGRATRMAYCQLSTILTSRGSSTTAAKTRGSRHDDPGDPLAGLARLDGTTPHGVPTVVMATASERRVRAWRVLMDGVTSSRRYASRLHVEVAGILLRAWRTGIFSWSRSAPWRYVPRLPLASGSVTRAWPESARRGCGPCLHQWSAAARFGGCSIRARATPPPRVHAM